MMKRIIALLLALILTVGLLPTVALAAETDSGTATAGVSSVSSDTDDPTNPVHIKKSVQTDDDGTGTLTLEAYVTDPMEIVTEDVPLDLVLVLDQSGSMGDCINAGCTAEYYTVGSNSGYRTGWYKNDSYVEKNTCGAISETYEWYSYVYNARPDTSDPDAKYYVKNGNNYWQVYYCAGGNSCTKNQRHSAGWFYDLSASHADRGDGFFGRNDNRVRETYWDWGERNTVIYKYVAPTSGKDHVSRLDVLKQVLTTFTGKVADKAAANKVAHRIAMVGFSSYGTGRNNKITSDYKNTEILTGTNLSARSTGDSWRVSSSNGYDGYNQIAYFPKESLSVANGKQRYEANPDDYTKALVDVSSETGKANVSNAIKALTAYGGTYTDYGLDMAYQILNKNRPAEGSKRQQVVILFTDGETDTSGNHKTNAKTYANSLKQLGATVYTVGLFADTQTAYDADMSAMSSNTATKTGYYLKASNAASLNAVFQQLTVEINKLMLTIDNKAVLHDTLSEYFDFNFTGSVTEGITIKTATVTGYNEATKEYSWQEDTDTNDYKAQPVSGSSKSFTVTGFDYKANAIRKTVEDGKEVYKGKKLIVTIPIKADTTKTSGWTAGKNYYDTNAADSAKLDNYTDEDGTARNTTLNDSPEAPVTGYEVVYDYGTNSEEPAGVTLPETYNKVYIKGQTHNVKDVQNVDGYDVKGWCTDADCATTAVTTVAISDSTIGSDGKVHLYCKYTKNTATVNLASYVKKTLTATSLPENFSETFTAKITGNDITEENGREIETEAFTKNDFTGTTTATKTFKESKITLSVGPHTFTVTEDEGTNSNITYDKLPKTFTLNVTSSGATLGTVDAQGNFTAAADQFVTIGNSYNPTSTSFSLTNKFQKTLNSNVTFDDLPAGAKEFKLGIWEEANTTETADYIGTATISKLEGSGSSYSETVSFAFTSGLTFDTVGTKTYKVKEITDSVPGMKYDTTEYTMTIKVKDKAGKLTVTEATVSDGTNAINLLNTTGTNSLEITNTFTAATLPLDPPSEEPESPTAGIKVFKSLTGDQKTETFTAKIYDGQTEKATAIADAKTGTLAAFDGFGTLVFTEAKTYNYIIKEIPGSTAGMKYDELFPNGHTMNITVEAEDNKLVVKTVTIDDKEINLADDAWLTITNTYTEPKDPSVVSKKVVTTDAHFPGGLDTAIDEFKSKCKIEKVLYPTGDGTTNNTLEVPYGTDSVTLLYAITVNRGTESDKMDFADDGAEFVFAVGAEVTKDMTTGKFDVTFNTGVSTAVIYVAKTHTPLNFVGGKCTVENVISEEIKATTTVTEKDPDKLYLDFSKFVQKELTATGTKTASDVNFTVDVKEFKTVISSIQGDEEVNTYAGEQLLSTTLTARFDSITGGETKTAPFNGSIVVEHAGTYSFELTEEDGQRTGVTYDDSTYKVYVYVKREGDKLVVGSFNIYKDYKLFDGNTITFHNTIDTGKDDYYPIIIPTIINKDTGMLNKTDHFAYVIGYPDGTVHPNGQITRAEVATIFFRLLRDEVRDGAFTTSNTYSDVAYGKWYNNPISTMSALGIITGYPDGTFKPNKPITRAEFAAIAARFDETQSGKSATFSDVIGHWAAKEIGIAYYNDWIKGYPDGTFKPDQNITRAEAMTLINRVLERKPESPADLLTNMNKWTDNMDTSKWYYLDVQEATNSHGYTRKTFNYELWRQMLPDPDWSRYER